MYVTLDERSEQTTLTCIYDFKTSHTHRQPLSSVMKLCHMIVQGPMQLISKSVGGTMGHFRATTVQILCMLIR